MRRIAKGFLTHIGLPNKNKSPTSNPDTRQQDSFKINKDVKNTIDNKSQSS
jgi:hypothetical protein